MWEGLGNLSQRWTGLSLVGSHSGVKLLLPPCFHWERRLLPYEIICAVGTFRACICLAAALAINTIGMETRHKILVLDDDADWLNLCNEMFAHLPSKPEIRTVASGARALALMETEPFRLLVCDLKMPRMDGLQVLSIVRRRFPELRTIVLSGLEDEEFRSRAYALGVDLFWLKTDMQRNSQMFLDCIESLLGRDTGTRLSRHPKQKPDGHHPDGMPLAQFHRPAHHARIARGETLDSKRRID